MVAPPAGSRSAREARPRRRVAAVQRVALAAAARPADGAPWRASRLWAGRRQAALGLPRVAAAAAVAGAARGSPRRRFPTRRPVPLRHSSRRPVKKSSYIIVTKSIIEMLLSS